MLEAHDSTSGDQSTAAARFAKRLAARECEEFDLADEKAPNELAGSFSRSI